MAESVEKRVADAKNALVKPPPVFGRHLGKWKIRLKWPQRTQKVRFSQIIASPTLNTPS